LRSISLRCSSKQRSRISSRQQHRTRLSPHAFYASCPVRNLRHSLQICMCASVTRHAAPAAPQHSQQLNKQHGNGAQVHAYTAAACSAT
jgi:hypothetical protein